MQLEGRLTTVESKMVILGCREQFLQLNLCIGTVHSLIYFYSITYSLPTKKQTW